MTFAYNGSQLPYIVFPELQLKILIDTGSTRSFVTPDIAQKYFCKFIKSDPFQISTAHGTSSEQFSTTISLSKLFNEKISPLKFYIFNFHNNFDCLLGIDNLKILKANVDLQNNMLVTPSSKIKIFYYNIPENYNNNLVTQPKTEQIIKIPIQNVANVDVITPYKIFDDLEIPECLTKAKNHEVICSILNKTEKEKSVEFSEPLKVINYKNLESSSNNIQNLNNLNSEKIKFDISKIKTEHMNSEEQHAILKLIKEFLDIFYIDGNKLNFTNKVKHQIKTSDEIPVYTRSYRYPETHKKKVQR